MLTIYGEEVQVEWIFFERWNWNLFASETSDKDAVFPHVSCETLPRRLKPKRVFLNTQFDCLFRGEMQFTLGRNLGIVDLGIPNGLDLPKKTKVWDYGIGVLRHFLPDI